MRLMFARLIPVLCMSGALFADTTTRPSASSASLFDPARHMRVAEVMPGMSGFGLSVFSGSSIEKFDVEVVSVLHNFNPKRDVILIRCRGQNLEHTGAIAGMSGSPIYLRDDRGRDRLVGAFAYGFPMAKDPVAGVQPIEYMLDLQADERAETVTGAKGTDLTPRAKTEKHIRWSPLEVRPLVGLASATTPRAPESTRLSALVTPLLSSGVSSKLLDQAAPLFRAQGLELLQAGASGGSSQSNAPAKIEPGSVLVAPLVIGDVDLVATGTCTEVLGDRVFAFGHSFNGEGPIALPMAGGQINGIIASLTGSYKLGSMTSLCGTLHSDQSVGVAGTLGSAPAMVPVELKIKYADGSQDVTYKFQEIAHPKLTPLITGLAIMSAVTGNRDLPQYHTLDYDVTIDFTNGRSVRVNNTGVNLQLPELFLELGTPLLAASENPFERVMPRKISGTIRVTPEAREAQILSINVPKLKFRPGERVKAYVSYRPFHAAEANLPIELDLPADLPDATYRLVISDWQRFLMDEQLSKPFRFTAESIDEVFAVLDDLESIKHNAVYARLIRQPDGVAVGRTAMPHLPSSKRNVLLGAGRSNVTPFVSSTVKTIPTDLLMNGAAEFAITIDNEVKVEPGGKTPKTDAPAKIDPGKSKPPLADPAE